MGLGGRVGARRASVEGEKTGSFATLESQIAGGGEELTSSPEECRPAHRRPHVGQDFSQAQPPIETAHSRPLGTTRPSFL